MHVDVLGCELFGFEFGQLGMRLDVLVRDGGTLFHYIAQVARHGLDTLALAHRALDEQDFAAHGRPGQAGYHARGFIALLAVVEGRGQAQVLAQVLLVDGLRVGFSEGDFLGRNAGNLGNLLLQAAHARFLGIIFDDALDGSFVQGNGHFDAMLLQLLGNEVSFGNLNLLLLQIPRDVDQLHAVQQGGLDGGNVVRRGKE